MLNFLKNILPQNSKALYFLLCFFPFTVSAQAPGDCGQLLFFVGISSQKADCNTPIGSITLDTSAMRGTRPLSFALNGQPLTTGLTFSGLTPGGYELSVTDAIGCKDTLEIFVSANSGITGGTGRGVNADCNTSNGAINVGNVVTSSPGPITVTLNTGSSFTYNTVPNNQFTNLPKGTYSLVITDGAGCKFMVNEIHVDNQYTSGGDCGAGDDLTIFEGESAFLNGHAEGSNLIFWDPKDDLSTPNEASTYATPPVGKHTYSINSVDANNCTICTDEVTVTVLPQIDPPNTFTPNGDGDNDTWVISGLELFPECKIWIYTRWGERIFHQKGYDKGTEWNGTNNGLPLPAATYYYVIDLKKNDTEGKPKRKAGSITIVK